MKKVHHVLLLAAAVLVLAFAGCAGGGAQQPSSSSAEETRSPVEQNPVETGSAPGALHVEGTRLVNSAGNVVQLRGASTHGLAWFPQYVNADLFRELAGWGANAVRLALYTEEYGGWCSGGNRDELRRLVDDGVRYATDAGMYVIVDWHVLSEGNPNVHADDAAEFFDDVSAAYAGQDNVIYEICNEPTGSTTWADVKRYAERIIPVIRANDPDALIIVGTPTWSQDVDAAAADPLAFDNVVYALHFYAATHKAELRERAAAAMDAGLPVFVSEFGVCDASGNGAIDVAEADAWIDFLDSRDVSYLMWNLSNKDESSSMFLPDCQKISGFEDGDLSQVGLWLRTRLLSA